MTHHKVSEIFVKLMHPWVLPQQGGQVRGGPATTEAQTMGCNDGAGGAWGRASWTPVRDEGQGEGPPWWSKGQDSALPVQGAQVPSLARQLGLICHS